MSAFHLDTQDGIGVLTFDLPGEKVNKFSAAVVAELDQVLDGLAKRSDLKGMIIRSAKEGIFVAGADLEEIRNIASEAEAASKAKAGQVLFQKLEDLPFPTVAAIDGACLGGGCELALACTARVASDSEKTRIGLPEVSLGFVPGWGGTQRLPRLVGLSAAMPVLLGGKPLDGGKAGKIGLVDRVAGSPFLMDAAREVLAQLIKDGGSRRGLRSRPKPLMQKLLDGMLKSLVYSGARKEVMRTTKGRMPAPLALIDLVNATLGSETGFDAEAKTFARLALTPESRALVGLFFASEAVKKDGGKPRGPALERPAVLGAGVMGGGIAWLFARKGQNVRVKDLNLEAVAKAYKTADDYNRQLVKRRRMRDNEARQVLAHIGGVTDWSGFKRCDVVVEAVVENLDIKRKVLGETETYVDDACILATNTSSLRVSDLARGLRRPQRFVGMHFFNPVNRMPLVEVVAGPDSDEDAVARVADLARRCGKTAVVVKDCPGFLVNRILLPYLNEAGTILQEGGDLATIDRIIEAYGLPMGPFRLADEVGIDVGHKVAKILHEGYGERMPVAAIITHVHEDLKLLGTKGGVGFYKHQGKKAVVNGAIAGAVQAVQQKLGLSPRVFAEDEVRARCLLIMVNEAARCIDEGICASSAILDLAMVMGTGWPPEKGGPLRHADTLGIAAVVDQLKRLADSAGPRFAPAALLVRMREKGLTFHGSDLAAIIAQPKG